MKPPVGETFFVKLSKENKSWSWFWTDAVEQLPSGELHYKNRWVPLVTDLNLAGVTAISQNLGPAEYSRNFTQLVIPVSTPSWLKIET